MWFFGGMLEIKKRENMENFKNYGRDLTKILLSWEKVLSYWNKWMEEII